MPIIPWIPTVTKINNGEDVSAETLNPIFAQHTQRSQHLYEKFESIGDKSVIIAYSQPVLPADPVVVKKYSVCYFAQDTISSALVEGITLAKVDFLIRPGQSSFTTAPSAYAMGIVKNLSTNNTEADVYLMGLVDLDVDIDDETNGLMQSTEVDQTDFAPGPLFLSRSEAGKLTRNPGGVSIYIGYAFNRRTLLLAPNVSEFNQFFTAYRYNILDRPAGLPVNTAGTWSISNADVTKVGWVPISALSSARQLLAPSGAKFFYNIPTAESISNDTGLILADREEQAELALALPPNPPNLSLLTVNGITQEPRNDHNPDGLYSVDELGIWWYDDTDGNQPWAIDIEDSIIVTANATTNEIAYVDHGFEIDDTIKFSTTNTLPSPLSTSVVYYVVELNGDDNHFKVSTTKNGSAVDITTTGTGVHSIRQPYIWKNFRGTSEYRPKIALQFVRINPAIREAVVTSIKRYNLGSDAIKFYSSDRTTEANVGELLARLQLNFVSGTAASSSATAIKSISYDETTGDITYIDTPIVSKLSAGSGITITPTTVDGAEVPGSFIVSSTANNTSGRVSSIEPDGADLLFVGLHSYLSMTIPSVLPSSIIGKITLPADVPNADMTFVMLLIGTESLVATKTVEFEFTYSVTKNSTVLNTTVSTPVTLSFNMPNPYTAKTCFLVGNDTNAINGLATFKIPASAFEGGNAAVNFKLARKLPGSNPLNSAIGIVDIYWKIG